MRNLFYFTPGTSVLNILTLLNLLSCLENCWQRQRFRSIYILS